MRFTGSGQLKSRRVGNKVFFDLLVMGGKFSVWVPEKLVPDVLEDRSVVVSGEIGQGAKGLYLKVDTIGPDNVAF